MSNENRKESWCQVQERCICSEKNKGLQVWKSCNPLILCGARSENRTRTVVRPRDFKSLASTSSAIRAWHSFYHRAELFVNCQKACFMCFVGCTVTKSVLNKTESILCLENYEWNKHYNPRSNTVILGKDILIVLGRKQQIVDLKKAIYGWLGSSVTNWRHRTHRISSILFDAAEQFGSEALASPCLYGTLYPLPTVFPFCSQGISKS